MITGPSELTFLCEHGPRDTCNCAVSATGTEQSLDELEFSRTACSAAQDGNVAKLRRILQRNPSAIRGDETSGATLFAGGCTCRPCIDKFPTHFSCYFVLGKVIMKNKYKSFPSPSSLVRRLYPTALCSEGRAPRGRGAAVEER